MKFSKIEDLITVIDERNLNRCDYSPLGININKDFMPTAANMDGIDTLKYKVVRNNMFVFSGMQTGRDMCIRLALYKDETPCIVSPAYTTFCIKDSNEILPEYFFMLFNRKESDRYGAFLSDSSVRANLDWERFISIQIPLPSIPEQQKIVNAWKALREIKEQNERIYAPLMQVCQSYIQELKHKYQYESIGKYIVESDDKNQNNIYDIDDVRGVSIKKIFIATKANMDGVPLTSYKIVPPRFFAANPNTARMGDKLSVALNDSTNTYLVSSIYPVFHIQNENKLLPEFLHLWLKRTEFDRYGRFHSWGSAREMFNYTDYAETKIPMPPIDVQRSIVNLYNCANEAKRIAEEADRKSKEICPALIQRVKHL